MRSAWLATCFAFSTVAQADEALWAFLPDPPPTSEISMVAGIDGNGGTTQRLSLAIEGPAASRLSASVGRGENTLAEDALPARDWSAGFTSDPGRPFMAGIVYSEQTNDEALDINGVNIVLGASLETIILSLSVGQRQISPQLKERFRDRQSRVDVESRDFSFAAQWFIADDWVVSGRFCASDYSKDLAALINNPRAPLVFSAETLSLSSGLEQRCLSAGVSQYFSSWMLGLEWSQSVSAVDDSRIDNYTLSAGKELSRNWSVELATGFDRISDDHETIAFASVLLAYRW